MIKKMLLFPILILLLSACGRVTGPEIRFEDGNWQYVTGPNGENCLIYVDGHHFGMECDSVNTP